MKLLYPMTFLLLPVLALVDPQYSHSPEHLWQKWSIDASGNGADGIHTSDINRDGRIDVVSGWEQSGEVKLYLNPGTPALYSNSPWPATSISGGMSVSGIEDAAFADLDGDGFADAVLSSMEGDSQALAIHWAPPTGLALANNWHTTVLTPSEPAGYMKARAGQLDGTGGVDIVAGTKTMSGKKAGIYWFQAPQISRVDNVQAWRRFFLGDINFKTVTLVIKDMNADSLPDIVYAGRNGLGWFKNPGYEELVNRPAEASWERVIIVDKGSEFAFCDHDRDGSEDIIVATSKKTPMVAKWLERLDDTGRHWAEYPIASDDQRPGFHSGKKFVLKGVACGYVDGDNKIDVVFSASGHGAGVFVMSPRAEIAAGEPWQLLPLTLYADNMKYDNLVLEDFDGDGDLDVGTTEEGEGIISAGDGVLWLENPLYSREGD